ERRAVEDHLGVVQVTGIGRYAEVADELGERLAGQLAAQARRQRAPLVVVEVRPGDRPGEVLQRAAARFGAHELDTVVVAQHAHVVGDDPEWSSELHGEVSRAGNALTES